MVNAFILQKYYRRAAELRAYAPLDGPKRGPPDRVKSSTAFQNRRSNKGAGTTSHLTPPAPAKAWTVDSICNTSSARPMGLKADSPVRGQGKQMPPNATNDLVVTSARIVSIQRCNTIFVFHSNCMFLQGVCLPAHICLTVCAIADDLSPDTRATARDHVP